MTSPVAAGLAMSRFHHCINVPHCDVETHHFNLTVILLVRGSGGVAFISLTNLIMGCQGLSSLSIKAFCLFCVGQSSRVCPPQLFCFSEETPAEYPHICWWCIFPTRCYYLCSLSVCATPAKCSLQFEASIYLIGGKQPLVKFEAHN